MSEAARFEELGEGSFVYALHNALPASVCRNMIAQFERSTDQQYIGLIGQQGQTDQSIKRSTDLRISGRDDWQETDDQLQQSLSEGLGLLAAIHPFFKANRVHDIGYNLQRTAAGEFYQWHTDSGPGEFTKRQLVAIWYLNELDSTGGETEFYFQKVRIRPEQGMLILFPPFWTHLHRGAEVLTSPKYIATTWVCTA